MGQGEGALTRRGQGADGGRVTLTLRTEDARWRLTVHVEGPGVPAAKRTAIFEPFHRLDALLPGNGLGLAIVRDIAAGDQGRAWVENAGPGATFVLHGWQRATSAPTAGSAHRAARRPRDGRSEPCCASRCRTKA